MMKFEEFRRKVENRMIDSLDLIIYRIRRLDFRDLKLLGIQIKPYNDTINDRGYCFEYKKIHFKYNTQHKYLLLITKVSEIIGKDNVTLSDKSLYEKNINDIIKQIIPLFEYKIFVNRIDYKVDLKLDSDEMVQEYINLINKHDDKYKYMRRLRNYRGEKYSTSTYLCNKTGQLTLNFYNKYQEQRNKKIFNDKYIGILRLEVQNKPARIKAQKRKENGMKAQLENYFSKEGMLENYFKIIKPYLYYGDYYKIKQAKKIIDKSDNSKKWKKKLKDFVAAVKRYGTVKNTYKNKFCCEDTGKRYVSMLDDLKINPITIDEGSQYEHLTNLYKMALEYAEENYFK